MSRTSSSLLAAVAGVTLAAAGAAVAQTPPDYTGGLNSGPPSAARPVSPATADPAPPPPSVQRPVDRPAPPPQPVQTAPAPPPRQAPALQTSGPVPTPPGPVAASPSVGPRTLTRAEIETLPFAVILPPGYALTAGRPGPDFQVWTVRKNGLAQLMIYAGPSSQFPIHSGETVEAGGRTTVVVVEDGRRRALEHLFRQSTAPNHIHVWVASVDAADRDQAEAIGHGISPR